MITDELLIKVISGNSTEEESGMVEDWRQSLPANMHKYNLLKLYWEKSLTLKTDFKPDENKAWETIKVKISEKRSIKIPYLKYAATIALIAVLSVVFVFVFIDPSMSNPSKSTNAEKTQNIPGNSEQVRKAEKIISVEPNKGKIIVIRSEDVIKEAFLKDSSLVILNKNSQLVYNEFSSNDDRVLKLKGQAHFDVVKGKPFIVKTKHLDVIVLGTSFFVDEDKKSNTIEISVESGIVEARETTNKLNSVTITKGQKYSYDVKKRRFTKISTSEKPKWFRRFFSNFKKIFQRLKQGSSDKN